MCIKILMTFIDPGYITPGDVTTHKECNKRHMQNTHISDRAGSKLLRNVSKCSFTAKRMMRRWDQAENRLSLLKGRERRGQRAASGMSK